MELPDMYCDYISGNFFRVGYTSVLHSQNRICIRPSSEHIGLAFIILVTVATAVDISCPRFLSSRIILFNMS